MDNNINALDELYKGCCMGIDALTFILSKVDGNDFKDLLEKQLSEYEELSNKIDDIYRDYTNSSIHETNLVEKVRTWYGIQKDTILDNSTSNLADLLVQGTNMGIVEGRKILNHKKLDKKVHKICSEYIKVQEKQLEKLKEYL